MNRAALSPRALWSMARESVSASIDDFAPSMGAGLAYYTVFSLAPLLVIVIAIAGLLFGSDVASGRRVWVLGPIMHLNYWRDRRPTYTSSTCTPHMRTPFHRVSRTR